MMTTPQTDAATEAERITSRLSEQAYKMGTGAMRQEFGQINAGLEGGGQFGPLQDAYAGARTNLSEAAATASGDARNRSLQENRRSIEGGNMAALTRPQDIGARMAQALYGSRLTEAGGQVDQLDKLMGLSLGQGVQAAGASESAMSNQLANIPNMRNYNSTYANILGAIGAGASIYGAGSQAGWFNKPMSTSSTGMG